MDLGGGNEMKMKVFNRDESDPLRVRRHVALACLVINIAIVVALVAAIFYGPPDRDKVIGAATQIMLSISVLIGGFTGAWFHSAYKQDQAKNLGSEPEDKRN